MKNITLAVDEAVLDTARIVAATQRTTVNALVRDYLTTLSRQHNERENARRELLKLAATSTAGLGPDYRFNREDAYEDRVFPRHQRADLRGKGQD